MSLRDTAFEAKLKWMRGEMQKLPPKLRPVATCVTLPDAARELGITESALKKQLKWRRWPGAVIDGVRYISSAQLDMLR